MKKTILVACATAEAFLFCHISQATPLRYTSRPDELSLFPHSLCISDFIFTGTATTTNDGRTAEFAVDEILWGVASSTNVIIRKRLPLGENLEFQIGEKYLVCAFTNDWWSMRREERTFDVGNILSKCVIETNRPSNNSVFDDYVILDNRRSAIPFTFINYEGTNYWDTVRTLATNIIDIAKHQGDDDKVRNIVLSILANPQKCAQFPAPLVRIFSLYKMYFCKGMDEPLP